MRPIDADAALETFQGLTELVIGEGAALAKALIFAGLQSRSVTPTISGWINDWISVKDRLPENTGLYLTYCKSFSDDRGFYRLTEYSAEQRGWFDWVQHKYNTEDSYVVWWMPLAELPKED